MQLDFEFWLSIYAIFCSAGYVTALLSCWRWRRTALDQQDVLAEQVSIMIDQRSLIEHQRGLLGAIEPVSTETLDQLH